MEYGRCAHYRNATTFVACQNICWLHHSLSCVLHDMSHGNDMGTGADGMLSFLSWCAYKGGMVPPLSLLSHCPVFRNSGALHVVLLNSVNAQKDTKSQKSECSIKCVHRFMKNKVLYFSTPQNCINVPQWNHLLLLGKKTKNKNIHLNKKTFNVNFNFIIYVLRGNLQQTRNKHIN